MFYVVADPNRAGVFRAGVSPVRQTNLVLPTNYTAHMIQQGQENTVRAADKRLAFQQCSCRNKRRRKGKTTRTREKMKVQARKQRHIHQKKVETELFCPCFEQVCPYFCESDCTPRRQQLRIKRQKVILTQRLGAILYAFERLGVYLGSPHIVVLETTFYRQTTTYSCLVREWS